ncbi:hypothetical protein HanIR_Chr04g0201001 [Helianthus annuus]|nr:hypothetical protein HanIR_Chr04g0201001 [Helianthus annuus]
MFHFIFDPPVDPLLSVCNTLILLYIGLWWFCGNNRWLYVYWLCHNHCLENIFFLEYQLLEVQQLELQQLVF